MSLDLPTNWFDNSLYNTAEDANQIPGWLAAHPRPAVWPIDAIATEIDWPLPRALHAIALASREGWVDRWPEAPDGPSVILAAPEAERYGLTLVVTRSNGWRWAAKGEPDRPTRRRRAERTVLATDMGDRFDLDGFQSHDRYGFEVGSCSESTAALLDAIAARSRGRGSLEAIEAAAGRGMATRALSGLWDASSDPWRSGHRSCTSCAAQEPLGLVYCSACDRSGLDDIIPPADPLPADKPTREYVRGRSAEEVREIKARSRRERRAGMARMTRKNDMTA